MRYIPKCIHCDAPTIEVIANAHLPLLGAPRHPDHWLLDFDHIELGGQLIYSCQQCKKTASSLEKIARWVEDKSYGFYVKSKEIDTYVEIFEHNGWGHEKVSRDQWQIWGAEEEQIKAALPNTVEIKKYSTPEKF